MLQGKAAAQTLRFLVGDVEDDDDCLDGKEQLRKLRAELAEEFELPVTQVRAAQQYTLLVCVIAMRKRRGIPFDKEFRQAKLLQRAMSAAAKNKLLCDALRFAI